MTSYTHNWNYQGRIITFSWLGDVQRTPSRVYTFAFTQAKKMLLVGGTSDPGY